MDTNGSGSRGLGRGVTAALNLTRLRTITPRQTMTLVRNASTQAVTTSEALDFLALVSIVCEIYRNYEGELISVRHFHRGAEKHEGSGHTCIVSRRAISTPAPSKVTRGLTETTEEDIIVKRTLKSTLAPNSDALKSLIAELRIRAHPPLRLHPNIVDLKGVAVDFEDDEATRPRFLLLEELASERSIEHFWTNVDLVRMPFSAKAGLCLDIARGLRALHRCGVAHGDIKPDNILVFKKTRSPDEFVAKLTDFGHSVFHYEPHLMAWSPPWNAPEVDPTTGHSPDFDGIKRADIYSFGLVVVSVVIGRDVFKCHGEFEDEAAIKRYKSDGNMLSKMVKIVEEEDKQNPDSDFDLVTLRLLLGACLQLQPQSRDLEECIRILNE